MTHNSPLGKYEAYDPETGEAAKGFDTYEAAQQYVMNGGHATEHLYIRPDKNLHGYTCAYCTGGGDNGDRPRWDTREGFERHMQRIHPRLPLEPMIFSHEEFSTLLEKAYNEGFEDKNCG